MTLGWWFDRVLSAPKRDYFIKWNNEMFDEAEND